MYLSENIAGQGLIQTWLLFDELEQVHAIAVLLHHHLEEQLILKHVQHLRETACDIRRTLT